jgi:hypothetical protein
MEEKYFNAGIEMMSGRKDSGGSIKRSSLVDLGKCAET